MACASQSQSLKLAAAVTVSESVWFGQGCFCNSLFPKLPLLYPILFSAFENGQHLAVKSKPLSP